MGRPYEKGVHLREAEFLDRYPSSFELQVFSAHDRSLPCLGDHDCPESSGCRMHCFQALAPSSLPSDLQIRVFCARHPRMHKGINALLMTCHKRTCCKPFSHITLSCLTDAKDLPVSANESDVLSLMALPPLRTSLTLSSSNVFATRFTRSLTLLSPARDIGID